MPVMAVRKLSISLREDIAEAAARLAESQGVTLSAWLSDATEHAIRVAEGLAAIEDHFAEHGEPSEAEAAWAQDMIATLRRDDS